MFFSLDIFTFTVIFHQLIEKNMASIPTIRSHNITDAALMEYANRIWKEMTNNASLFPDPTPDLETFKEAADGFQQAITDAAYRDRRAVLIREGKRKELLKCLRYLSFYVDFIARGNEDIILESGFVPSKPQSSSEQIPLTEDFRATPTIGTGAIKLRIKAWRLARVYQFEYRKKGEDNPWITVLSSKSSCTLSNLELLEEYEFRVCYVGRTGKSPYSEVITSRVY